MSLFDVDCVVGAGAVALEWRLQEPAFASSNLCLPRGTTDVVDLGEDLKVANKCWRMCNLRKVECLGGERLTTTICLRLFPKYRSFYESPKRAKRDSRTDKYSNCPLCFSLSHKCKCLSFAFSDHWAIFREVKCPLNSSLGTSY